ncbi:MAG TPA: helix-turn-helix domain-containing protein [Steroidobacteraceae bacterium]|nr:helix-turn-helix domain-containing protein [Steroidobacteraceae bacterium]
MVAPAEVEIPPLTAADFKDVKRLRRVPRVKTLRRVLQLTQRQFARRFQIPLATLRDWEAGRATPDATARAYLQVIARDHERIAAMLQTSESEAAP